MKNEYLVALNCPTFYVPTLNEEIIENKRIHHYYKRVCVCLRANLIVCG